MKTADAALVRGNHPSLATIGIHHPNLALAVFFTIAEKGNHRPVGRPFGHGGTLLSARVLACIAATGRRHPNLSRTFPLFVLIHLDLADGEYDPRAVRRNSR